MTNGNLDGKAESVVEEKAEKKPWRAPQLTAVSIAGLTELMLSPGTDGAGQSTMS